MRLQREFFPRQAKALSDPRVTLRVQNAATYVQEARYPIAGVNNGTRPVLTEPTTGRR
jgi:hypothetical protein